MPHIVYTEHEVFYAAIKEAQEVSAQIHKLADLDAAPLVPGESVADRHHKIAKLGKRLAVAFTAVDTVMSAHAQELRHALELLDERTAQQQTTTTKTETN